MKRLISVIFIIVFTTAGVYYGYQAIRGEKQKITEPVQEDAVRVVTATVAPHTFSEKKEAVVSLKARKYILLNPKVSGNIQDILVDFGDRVSREDIVVRLEKANYDLAVQQAKAILSSAEAAVALAKVQFEQAEKKYRRASDLLAENVYPQSRFDAAEAAYKTTQEAVKSAIAQRRQAGRGDVQDFQKKPQGYRHNNSHIRRSCRAQRGTGPDGRARHPVIAHH